MRLALIAVCLMTLCTTLSAQTMNCAAGRAVLAKRTADLMSSYPGTALTVEGCAAACEDQPPADRNTCFAVACGVACLVIGYQHCLDYYAQKIDLDGFRKNVDALCKVDEAQKLAQERENDTLAWSVAAATGSLDGFLNYIEGCNSVCANRQTAQARVDELRAAKDLQAWQVAEAAHDVAGYDRYLKACSTPCQFRDTATDKRTALLEQADAAAWQSAQAGPQPAAMEGYLKACNEICAQRAVAQAALARAKNAARLQKRADRLRSHMSFAMGPMHPVMPLAPMWSPLFAAAQLSMVFVQMGAADDL